MKTNLRARTMIGTLLLALCCGLLSPGIVSAQSNGVEELTRGPVHEAFAESISYNPEPGLIIESEPPKLIEELPPEERPVGNNIAWIPGYWAWDDERTDFIWISGVWRNIPPGRQWVPGYWNPSDSRYQWISGYWALADEQETTYLPAPPKSVENGPNSDAPSNNHIWVSGSWDYVDDRYAWRPGYWEPARENWIWIPSTYRWTPRGYVFIEGYWDYDVERRGMIFAPVYFDHVVYSRPDYYYTPVTVIALNVFARHLFVRPRYSHYYFGDYYEPRYNDWGFYASFHYHRDRRGYDPFYAHDRWHHRNDRDWDRRRNDDFEFYRDNRDARPPRTLAALLQRPENERRGRRDDFELARPLSRVIEDKDSRKNFVKVDRKEFSERGREIRDFSRERGRLESLGDGPPKAGDKPVRASREKFAKSPVVSRRIDELKGEDAPPPRRERRDESADNRKGSDGKPGERPDGPKPPDMVKKEQREDPTQEQREQTRDRKPDAPGRADTPERDRREPGKEAENNRRQEMKPSVPQREQKEDPTPAVRPPKREPQSEPAPRPTPKREEKAEPTPRREVEKRPTVTPPQRKEVERKPEPRSQETKQRPSAPERRETTPQPQRKVERPQAAPQRPQKQQEQRPQRSEGGGGDGGRKDKKD